METTRSRRALLVATGGAYSGTGDVEPLAAVLVDASIGAFQVSRLVDRPAAEITREIEGFFREAMPDELLLLYFSCHAVVSPTGQLYLAGIEDRFIADAMQHSRARSIVLILDCSYSGKVSTIDVELRFAGPGRVTLSSSAELEYRFEDADPATDPATGMSESPFTRFLVEGLETGNADIDRDGRISVDELYDYVRQRMRDVTHQTPGMAGDLRGDIVIARSPRVHPPPTGRPESSREPPGPPPSRPRRWPPLRIPRPSRPGSGSQDLSPLAERELARARDDTAIDPVSGAHDGAEESADIVDCTVFAPPRAQPSQTVLIQVFAHLLEQAQEVTALAQRFDHAAHPRGVRSLASPIPRGGQLTFELRMPAAKVEDPVQTLVWRGRPESVQFAVLVPRAARGECIGTVVVRRDMCPVGHVKFKLDIEPAAAGRSALAPVGDQAKRYTRAFLSYASADRPKVLDRVQMLRLLRVDYFQDLLTLEPGERWEQRLFEEIERSDLFILFWSRQARASKWVRRETRHALGFRAGELGAPEICPVIVEGPPVARPWRELADLHFNDSLLYIKAGHR